MKSMLFKQFNMTSRTICEKSQLWSINDTQSTPNFIGSYCGMFRNIIGMFYTLKEMVLVYLIPSKRPIPIPVRSSVRR